MERLDVLTYLTAAMYAHEVILKLDIVGFRNIYFL